MYNLKKVLIVGIMMLFVGTSFTSLVGSICPEDQIRIVTIDDTELSDIDIIMDGTLGENGWYVSCVTITITWDPEEIAAVYYRLDDGEWTLYTEPIVVSEDGHHIFCWYYVDNEGNQSEVECMDFKIDQTDPTIYFTTEKIGFRKWLLTADVSDETSGVAKVEFYVNGELLGEVREPPYEWIYNHRFSVRGLILNPKITEETVSFFAVMAIGHSVFDYPVAQAIVYDNAGNDRISSPCPLIY